MRGGVSVGVAVGLGPSAGSGVAELLEGIAPAVEARTSDGSGGRSGSGGSGASVDSGGSGHADVATTGGTGGAVWSCS